jgi:hypothetical protein
VTAAVPGPRFRDTLAEALVKLWADDVEEDVETVLSIPGIDSTLNGYLDALMPVFAAELARVQSDGEKRAAEELRAVAGLLDQYVAHAAQEARQWAPDAHWVTSWEGKQSAYAWSARLLRARAAALAQPAPGAADEDGER